MHVPSSRDSQQVIHFETRVIVNASIGASIGPCVRWALWVPPAATQAIMIQRAYPLSLVTTCCSAINSPKTLPQTAIIAGIFIA